MKRKIAAFALAISMVVTGIFQPMTTMANETVQTTQTVAGCSYEVTLPDDYATGDRNYPVIYVMPQNGLAKDNSGLTEELQTAMKSETGMDMIVVRPTFKAGMDLHDVMEAVVDHVDNTYRTIPDKNYRVIAGTGTGGYLAYILGLTDGLEEVSETVEEAVETVEETEEVAETVEETEEVAETVEETEEAAETVEETEEAAETVEETEEETETVEETEEAAETVEETEEAAETVEETEEAAETVEETEEAAETVEETEEAAETVEETEEVTETVEETEEAAETVEETEEVAETALMALAEETETEEAEEENDSTPCTTLAEPGLFGSLVSIRGDFVSSSNIWYSTYGDVYDYLVEMGASTVSKFYRYLDAPVSDDWTNMEGSTNDLGVLFIDFETSSAMREFTVRSGAYSSAFLTESAKRVVDRLTGRMLSSVISGSASLEKAALTADAEKATVNYSVNVLNGYPLFANAESDIAITISLVHPTTGEVLDTKTVTETVTGPGNYTGSVDLKNMVDGTSSDVQLAVEIFGAEVDVAEVSLIRIQDIVIDGDYQFIDLMGDWYFNYVGMDSIDVPSLTEEEYEQWSIAQPGLGNWVVGYGNITEDMITVPGWASYMGYDANFFISGSGYYVKTFEIPEEFDCEDPILSIGSIDDRCEVYVNGTFVGATGMENGESTGEATWDKDSYFTIDSESDILNIGGMNTVVVRAFNDGPYGNGGWYEGPVGLYSQEAFSGAAPSESRFIEKSFASSYAASAMGQEGTLEKNYLVYLPENYYESEKYYPTVYLLHQFNSTHTSYMTDNVDQLLDQAIADGLFDEMIVIVPDSDANSWWTGDWEKMVTEELIPLIDSEYRTIKDARYRMTAGCSMGGQGAFGVALTNPDLFSGAISFFGALSMAPTEEEDALHIAETESVEYLKYYTLYFICGNQDSYGFGEPAVELSQILSNRGVEHGFFIENGQHDSVFYVPYFTDAFAYLRANMYQSDETVETLLSGTAAIDTQNGTKVNVTFKALEGIEEYFNVIPASSYTENANPDLSIPLMIQVVQDGKVVHTQVERNHVVNSKNTTASYTYDFAKYVDASKDYTIVYKAAIFDRVVELARVSSKVSDENKDNTTIILPTQTPSTNTNTGTNVNTNTNTSTSAGTTTSASSAQTGDSTPVALYFVISVAALAGIGLSVFKKRKRA